MNVQLNLALFLCLGAVRSDLKQMRIDNGFLLTGFLMGAVAKVAESAAFCLAAKKWPALDEIGVFRVFTAIRFVLQAGVCSPDVRDLWIRSLLGMLLPLLLLGGFRFFRVIGAGDIKLLCVLGWLMEDKILDCMWWSFFIAALLACAVLLEEGMARERWTHLTGFLHRRIPERSEKTGRSGNTNLCVRMDGKTGVPPYIPCSSVLPRGGLHMAVPIGLGVLLWAGGMY